MAISAGPRKAIVLLILVFGLGIMLGIAATRLVDKYSLPSQAGQPPDSHTKSLEDQLALELNLTSDQRTRIADVLAHTRLHYAEIQRRTDPEYEKVRQDSRDEIRKILTLDQGARFDAFLHRIEQEHDKDAKANR